MPLAEGCENGNHNIENPKVTGSGQNRWVSGKCTICGLDVSYSEPLDDPPVRPKPKKGK